MAAAPGSPWGGGEGRNELSLVRSPDEADASTGNEIGQRWEPVLWNDRLKEFLNELPRNPHRLSAGIVFINRIERCSSALTTIFILNPYWAVFVSWYLQYCKIAPRLKDFPQ